MKVLVTGAGGGIGRVAVAHLAASGHEVVALVERPGDAPEGVPATVGDCGEPAVVDRALDGVEAVVHLAAVPAPIGAGVHVFVNNVRATYVVLDRAAAAGVRRAAIASSISVLGLAWGRPGLTPAYVPIDEDHPILAEDPYALSKQTDENTARMIHRRSGLDVLALRFPFTGGDDRVAERAAAVAADAGEGVKDLWAWLHAQDAAVALRLAVESDVTGCHALNVVAPETISAVPTEELLDRYHPTAERRRPLPGTATPYATDRAEALLGFRAARRPPTGQTPPGR